MTIAFKEFQSACAERCERVWPDEFALRGIQGITHWTLCIQKEMGELSEEVMQAGLDGYMDEGRKKNIEKELADITAYVIHAYESLGTDAGEAVKDKFNEVSKRVGCSITL